jgi:hypothetical protein
MAPLLSRGAGLAEDSMDISAVIAPSRRPVDQCANSPFDDKTLCDYPHP